MAEPKFSGRSRRINFCVIFRFITKYKRRLMKISKVIGGMASLGTPLTPPQGTQIHGHFISVASEHRFPFIISNLGWATKSSSNFFMLAFCSF